MEKDLITLAYDDTDKYKIKIDAMNQVYVWDKLKNEAIYNLGCIDAELVLRLFSYMEIAAVKDDSIRVLKINK